MTTIVMTGGTSGFGATAAERLATSPTTRLLLGARTRTAATESRIPATPNPAAAVERLPLDLTSLESVHSFAASVRDRLSDTPIDALILNAGIIRPDTTARTPDGYETTFAVNHLAHYLLARLLLPHLSDTATVILTTSGTHDPATGSPLATPRHADAHLLAHPDQDPALDPRPKKAGEHAYTASKLCAVLTARALSDPRHTHPHLLTAIAFCPGQVFGTGLAHNLSLPLRTAWRLLGTPLGRPLRLVNPNFNTRAEAGTTLAALALGHLTPPDRHLYAALRRGTLTWPALSPQAGKDELSQALWTDSAKLAGLPD
ncbi:SDR family NAD(P)-dependent oxidoreductase [Nocardia sp. 2]|uniref:SDR family NAD(P)-dependent oxidoreductase n=1 Tax=Nocardia acididurans TaxID=2802282 RepID=A0ABS1M307_9NOCA|nr:SDR family NAD(P)-dependent oxidoreductase [Nocardia acididurans]MBL1075047.1 SDR family NAD(P)-dependent oxidoreductase [Nocardia acididurans]